MEFILWVLSKIPEQFNWLLYIIGALVLAYIGYLNISTTLLTSKFELLFFTKSQLFTHSIKKSIINIGAYQVVALIYAVIITSANINPLELSLFAFLLFISTALIMFIVILIHKRKSKTNKNSRLRINNKIKKEPTEKQKKLLIILIISNAIFGMAFYVLFINFLIRPSSHIPEYFQTPFDYIFLSVFLLFCPFLLVFFYNQFINRIFNRNVNEKHQYQINHLEVEYINEYCLLTYCPIEKDKFILVKPKCNHSNEAKVKNFFLYDLSNKVLHEFMSAAIFNDSGHLCFRKILCRY